MLARRFSLLLVASLAACPKPEPVALVDAGVSQIAMADAGAQVTVEKVDAWLRWQASVMALPVPDAGLDVRVRARDEAKLLREVGLSSSDADAIEAVVAAVVAERNVAKISGAEALAHFKEGLAQLSPEQRTKAEAAITDLQAKSPPASLAPVELEFGGEAVRAVLAREVDVTRAWDALLAADK